MPRAKTATVLLIFLIIGLSSCAPSRTPLPTVVPDSPPPSVAETEAIKLFRAEVDRFAALHRKLEATLPPLPEVAAPAAVHAHERALEKLLAAARPGAKQGDVFVPAIRPYIHQRAAEVFRGRTGAHQIAEIEEESSERRLPARVNERYPDEVPLSAVSFQLLAALPELPEEVEYRFLARHLILLDAHARIVIDVLPNVLPRR